MDIVFKENCRTVGEQLWVLASNQENTIKRVQLQLQLFSWQVLMNVFNILVEILGF